MQSFLQKHKFVLEVGWLWDVWLGHLGGQLWHSLSREYGQRGGAEGLGWGRREVVHWLGHISFFFFFFWPRCGPCGILVSPAGIEPVLPAVEARSPNHLTAREVPSHISIADACLWWRCGWANTWRYEGEPPVSRQGTLFRGRGVLQLDKHEKPNV